MAQQPCSFHRNSNSKYEGIQSNRNTWTQAKAHVVIFCDMKAKLSPAPHGRTFSAGMPSRRTLFQFAGERVRPQGHCSSLPVGVRPQEGHCSSLPVGVRPQEGHCSSLPVRGYVLKKDTVPVCRWEGTSSRTLFQFAANGFILTAYYEYNCLTSDICRPTAHPISSLCSYFKDKVDIGLSLSQTEPTNYWPDCGGRHINYN